MTTTQAVAAALGLAFAGFAAFALAMERHHEQATGREGLAGTVCMGLRARGLLLMSLALPCCLQPWGAPVAAIVWLGILSCAALMTTLVLSYAPRWLIRAAAVAGASALAVVIYALKHTGGISS
ncbi:membrane protein [Bordetella ansorpii]|uniref:Membrane protein n=1 Tax=Bordetella ansorpii TaxID=288768 RepID=A0A146AKS7_9BORD|nr:DUF3325 domain-containing protein [Bordetella ansorpii]CZZ88944.1 membrane protein [Bordetella ansorpii]